MSDKSRFVLIDDEPEEFPITETTWWWWDMARPLDEGEEFVGRPFVAVECYKDRDNPNNFIRCEDMRLLFTDQAEYYVVCEKCHFIYRHLQWSGSTRNPNWRKNSIEYLNYHQEKKGWCQFCDPIFGNGGWRL